MEKRSVSGQVAKYYITLPETEMTRRDDRLYAYINRHKFKLDDDRYVLRLRNNDDQVKFENLMAIHGVRTVRYREEKN